ncbi:MAG: hypothetical protein ABH986_03475 [archaeon]
MPLMKKHVLANLRHMAGKKLVRIGSGVAKIGSRMTAMDSNQALHKLSSLGFTSVVRAGKLTLIYPGGKRVPFTDVNSRQTMLELDKILRKHSKRK